MYSFGKKLKECREAKKISQNELAKLIDRHHSAIGKYERDEVRSSVDVAVKMAQLNLFNAVEIIKTEATEGIVSLADGDEQKMMLSGLKRFTRYNKFPKVTQLREQKLPIILLGKEYMRYSH